MDGIQHFAHLDAQHNLLSKLEAMSNTNLIFLPW